MSENQSSLLEQAARYIGEAHTLLICAGAGMGVDSGLPDFRGDQGFWNAYPPYSELGLNFYDLANPHWFQRDPELAWGFYGHRLELYRETTPHDGFQRLLSWGNGKPGKYFVFTSNVDGHFLTGGFSDDRIEECHGAISFFQCSIPCSPDIWNASETRISIDTKSMRALPPLPACPRCGAVARPNILMFGDWNWVSTRTNRQHEAFWNWEKNNSEKKIAVIECGAGTAVPTVRDTAEKIAGRYGGKLIRINPREPQVPEDHIGLEMTSLDAIMKIHELLQKS